MTAFFIAVVIIILSDSIRVWSKLMLGNSGTRDRTRRPHDESVAAENMPAFRAAVICHLSQCLHFLATRLSMRLVKELARLNSARLGRR